MKNLIVSLKSKTKNADLNILFVRNGEINEWINYFNKDSLLKLYSVFGELMLKFGYEIDN